MIEAWALTGLREEHAARGGLYHEFLRKPSLSCGLYVLGAGTDDPQTPHGEDEVYHVLAGSATVEVDGEERPVGPGDTIFVAARVPHRFCSIERRLELLVFFAPAESA